VTSNNYYSCSETGLLNKYLFTGDKKMLTIVSESQTNIRVGETTLALNTLRCSEELLIPSHQSELYIVHGGKEMAINLAEIKSKYDVDKIVICEDATKTTYKTCCGQYDTQDLSVMYITLAGRIYYGGKCVYCPFSMLVAIILIIMFVIIVALALVGLVYYAIHPSS
jgi:hypothetical protein